MSPRSIAAASVDSKRAAEPSSAALDLIIDAAASNFTRGSLLALLRSPHFVFRHDEVGRGAELALAFQEAVARISG